MQFLVILLAISVQRFLLFVPMPFQIDWFVNYYHWYVKQFKFITQGHGLFGLSMLLVPLLLVISLFFSIIYHVFGTFGYWVINSILLWYCLDVRDIKNISDNIALAKVLEMRYSGVFALIFWFALFGPVGLALYYILYTVTNFKLPTESVVSKSIIHYASIVLSILDWAPLRAYLLSLALVHNFAQMFSSWSELCFSGIANQDDLIKKCTADKIQTQADAVNATDRALIVWLIIIGLVMVV